MRFYLAPLEGVTGHVFREAYDTYFHDVDKYFTPFLSANDHLNFKTKREIGLLGFDTLGTGLGVQNESQPVLSHAQIEQSHSQSAPLVPLHAPLVPLHAPLVPQILGNEADKVIALIEEIASILDVDEINLNFGCPSGTVTGKNRGAGIFKDLIAMDDFLDRLFAKMDSWGRGCGVKNDKNEPLTPSPMVHSGPRVRISLKTRIGWADEKEWEKIVRIYADYPFSEIIVHPRVRADQYSKPCRMEAFAYALSQLPQPLCYNGEIHTVEDYEKLCKLFPTLDCVMLGRGIVKNPFLISDIRRTEEAIAQEGKREAETDAGTPAEQPCRTPEELKRRRDFVARLEEQYLEEMQCEEHAVMRMKEFWLYFGASFPAHDKALKAIKKAKTLSDYRLATLQIPY